VLPDQNGFLVPLKDANAIAAALDRILSDPALAARLGARAREMALAEFDEQIIFQRVVGVYRRLLTAKGLA
jgi:glycosyltransferase involved in cell wall biosynthesis